MFGQNRITVRSLIRRFLHRRAADWMVCSGGMLTKLLAAWALMGGCVAIHAAGVSAALRWLRRHAAVTDRFWPTTRMFVRLAAWIVMLHLLEIAAWALLYGLRRAMPDLPSAVYFSAVTYTTTGYGDLVLPPAWRLVGAVEALTGILMCGWSTGFFVAAVSRINLSSGSTPP